MRMFRSLVLSAAALAGAAAALAAATPANGTIGTTLTIDVADAGTKKPNCFLRDPATTKKFPLKVTAYTANSVTADVVAGYAGTFDLVVDTKDGMDETTENAFTMEIPAAASITPPAADPGATVTIDGEFFGTRKPKVYVGGKKAKVVTYTDASVSVLVPKSLPNGTYDVNLRNKIGEDTLGASLTVQNSAVGLVPITGKELVSGTFGAINFKSGGPNLGAAAVTCFFTDLTDISIVTGTSISVKGTTVTNTTVSFSFVQDLNGTLPATVTAGIATLNRNVGPSLTAYTSAGPGGTFSVTVDRVVGGRAQGTFTGTMNKGAGDGAAQIQVTGRFVADVTQ